MARLDCVALKGQEIRERFGSDLELTRWSRKSDEIGLYFYHQVDLGDVGNGAQLGRAIQRKLGMC